MSRDMNKWWVVVLALPAVGGLVWMAITSGADGKTPARSLPKPPSTEAAASSPVQAQPPASGNVPHKSKAVATRPASNTADSLPTTKQMPMRELQDLLDEDPEAALAAAREDLARDPEGPDAAEQTWVVVKALTVMGRLEEAHREAEVMVPKFRGTKWANDVERHVLAHP